MWFVVTASLAIGAPTDVDALLTLAETDRTAAVQGLRAIATPGAVAWADWLETPPAPDAPDAPARLRAVGDASDATVPCWLLRDRPDAAAAFGAWYGSSRDAFPPLCRPAHFDTPAWTALRDALWSVADTLEEGALCGTLATAVARDHYVDHLTRHLRGTPVDATHERARAEAAVAWVETLSIDAVAPALAPLQAAQAKARAVGPAWWVDAAVADRLEAARRCVGDAGEHRGHTR